MRTRSFPAFLFPAPGFFRTRPLAAACCAFALGIFSARLFLLDGSALAAAAVLPALAPHVFSRAGRGKIIVALCFLLGFSNCAARLHAPPMPQPGKWTIEGTICSDPAVYDDAMRCYLRDVTLLTGDGGEQRLRGRVYCYLPQDAESGLSYGQRIRVQGKSYALRGQRNPGGYNEKLQLNRNGAHVRLYASAPAELLAPARASVRGTALAISHALGERMDALFGEASPMLRALLLGDSREIPGEWSQWMNRAGVAHLLAVSGLHTALWFALMRRAVQPFHPAPAVRLAALGVLLALYALLTGLRSSVLRASVMLLLLEGARTAQRKADPVTSLSAAGFAILAFRPLELFAAGFQLSFGAALGLTLVLPALKRRAPKAKSFAEIYESAAVSLSAQLGGLPAAAACFGGMSLTGLFVNLVAVPMAGVLLPAGALAVALDAVWRPLGAVPATVCRGICAMLLRLARLASGTAAFLRVPAFRAWTACAYYAGLFLVSTAVVWRRRTRALVLAALCAVCVLCGAFFGDPECFYEQLDTGEGLCGVLHVDGKMYVYDCGRYNDGLADTLRRYPGGVEAVVVSHANSDHYNGLWGLLEDGVKIGALCVPANAAAFGCSDEYFRLLATAQEAGVRIVELSAGDTIQTDELTVDVLAPERDNRIGTDANDRSLVLRVVVRGQTLLFTGDADGPTEPAGVACDVLQVPHHGSRKACDEEALAGVHPQIALISCGNSPYHPDAETVARLERAGAEVCITRESGCIRVVITENELKVEEFIK